MDDEAEYWTDSKYKQFTSAVDKTLKSFEYSSEWADLISCLGKLNKVITTYSTFPVIPRKLLLGKRLAQCLHPALPSGVHLKALETYQLIFKHIGTARLTQDLFIYSSGLFPLLAQAAMSVKPVLLGLYEEFYVPLGIYLVPGLPGFILALLPGIEEASEHTERTISILENVCQNSQKESFFSALWGCVLHSSQVRLSALTFVLGHLGKPNENINKNHITGNNKPLMVNALCAALEDNDVLVQRIMLDFLLAFIPMQTDLVSKSELIRIIVCTLNVVLRRDMSLNRRLYQWILNVNNEGLPNDHPPSESMSNEASRKSSISSSPSIIEDETMMSSYFETYSKKYVIAALINLFQAIQNEPIVIGKTDSSQSTSRKSDKLKPFRILISLLDKPEIGSAVLEDVLMEVLRALHHECNTTKEKTNIEKEQKKVLTEELIKTANLLFNAFEPYFIWEYLEKALKNSFIANMSDTEKSADKMDKSNSETDEAVVTSLPPQCTELFTLIDFLLDVVCLESSTEIQTEYWPSLLICIINEMTDHATSMKIHEIYQGISVALKLLSKISPSIKSPLMTRKDSSYHEQDVSHHKSNWNGNETSNMVAASPFSSIQSGPYSLDYDQGFKSLPANEKYDIMQVCVIKSKAFFYSLVTFKTLPWLSNEANSQKRIPAEQTDDFDGGFSTDLSENKDTGLKDDDLDMMYKLTFTALCRYLVELSCFPCWTSAAKKDKSTNECKMADWLTALLSCASQVQDISIQTTAMGTLMDLINVSLCVFPSLEKGNVKHGAANVIPLISPSDFAALEKSSIYQDLAKTLWVQICPENCQLHFLFTELFLRLHNIASSALTCEDVISKSLVHHNLSNRRKAHWKFSVLWNLSREFYKNESSKSSRGGNRSLDRCMMLMLDSLNSLDPTIRKFSQEWLKQAIHYGDIGKILEPLLLTMLNPTSQRISIHYASLWKSSMSPVDVANGECIVSARDSGREHDLNSSDSENDLNDSGLPTSEQMMVSSDSKKEVDVTPEISYQDKTTCLESSNNENDFADDEDEAPQQQQLNGQAQQQQQTAAGAVNGKKIKYFSRNESWEAKRGRKTSTTKLESEILGKTVHPLHVHRLFYTQQYDTTQTVYALKAVMSILQADGKAFVFSAATTSMNMCNTAHQIGLRELLIRHRRALTGKDFYGSLADSQQLLIKASTAKYMEILLSICLYFIRSDYLLSVHATDADLHDNFRVRVCSIQALTQIVEILLEVVVQSGAAFSSYVLDLFNRCKVQRIALHCLLSSVYTLSLDKEHGRGNDDRARRNELGQAEYLRTSKETEGDTQSDIQGHLLQLIKKLIFLEERIGVGQADANGSKSKRITKERKNKLPQKLSPFEYALTMPIVSQPMYLSVVLSALKEEQWSQSHHEWIALIIETLSKSGDSLPKIVVPVVDQICLNLKSITKLFHASFTAKSKQSFHALPVDHMLTLLEDLTSLCHFCLIAKEAAVPNVPHRPLNTTRSGPNVRHEDNPSSIFTSLVHVFSSQNAPNRATSTDEVSKPFLEAKEGLLTILPAILSSLLTVWHTWKKSETHKNRWRIATELPLPVGNAKHVRQSILQFLTPLAMQHTLVFLAAVADVWNSLKPTKKDATPSAPCCSGQTGTGKQEKQWLTLMNQRVLPLVTEEQQSLMEIVMAIKVLSIDTIIETSKQVLRQTLAGKDRASTGGQSLELNLLQFLYEFLQKISNDQLTQIKPVLLSLLKDILSLNPPPPALFVLLNVFYVFVVRIPCPEERRTRRELQDLALKFFEACNTIAAASLENSTWFRRNVAVLPQSSNNGDAMEPSITDVTYKDSEILPSQNSTMQTRNAQYSTQAICLMAEVLPSMLDLLYISEEKDKIANFFFYVMYNLTPYLRNHSSQNTASFRVCSGLLSAVTDYQYTLRSWKKDVYELFLDNDFFKLDLLSLQYWRSIIDRLMTYDNATFKDLMTRINLTQSGAINIFANREQEMEQRASLLKRLTFVIFCGEVDQYHSYMPDIQERLVDSLRQMQAPVLYEQVFFCFRVLIMRMSSHHLTSLWPPIVTELILVFLQMERELLSSEGQQSKIGIMGTIESFFTLNGVYKSKGKWLGLYLETCKLLDLSFSLQSDEVPHFQLYRWAFVDTPGVEYEARLLGNKAEDKTNKKQGMCDQGSVVGGKNQGAGKADKQPVVKQDKVNTDNISKLSVMNAPLSSKLRKAEKKGNKKKSNAEQEKDQIQRTNFAPYLSKVTKLLLNKVPDAEQKALTVEHPLEMRQITSVFELLPFFISVTGTQGYNGEQKITPLSSVHLEELIEKDFQDVSPAR